MPKKTTAQRLYSKLLIKDLLRCWDWQASKNGGGYGRMRVNGKHRPTHRIVWELVYGNIPDGMHVLHRCDNKACCNPTHLFTGTHWDNMADMVSKGKQAYTITEEQVRAIRVFRSEGLEVKTLSIRFGVSSSHIYKIVTRRRRKYLRE